MSSDKVEVMQELKKKADIKVIGLDHKYYDPLDEKVKDLYSPDEVKTIVDAIEYMAFNKPEIKEHSDLWYDHMNRLLNPNLKLNVS